MSSEMSEIGKYEQKQLYCKSKIISWSHNSRFEFGRRLVEPFAGQKLLDYGCGDGTFLKQVFDIFPKAVGADLAEDQILDCQRRFRLQPSLKFLCVKDLHEQDWHNKFDVITCMEVLEHCIDRVVAEVLDDLANLVNTEGTVIISVPVEIGPTLIIKQILRTLAGWRDLGDYKWTEKYSLPELLTMVFASSTTGIKRPVHGDLFPGHGHKGFNWRVLEKQIQQNFQIKDRMFTPLGSLGGYFSSQVWFICNRRK